MPQSAQKGHPNQVKHTAETQARCERLASLLCKFCQDESITSVQLFQRDLKHARVETESVIDSESPRKKARPAQPSQPNPVLTSVMEFSTVNCNDPKLFSDLFKSVEDSARRYTESGGRPKNKTCIETMNRSNGRPRFNFCETGRKERWVQAGGSRTRTSVYFSHAVLGNDGQFPSDIGQEGSHLCNNPQCCRLEHLAWESGKVQRERF